MKKVIILTAIFYFLGVQNSIGQKARIGLNAGPGLSSLNENQLSGPHFNFVRWTINGGIFLDAPLTNFFSIQPGLNFIQKGSEQDLTGDIQREILINYLEVPANAIFYFKNKKGSFLLGSGLTLAMAISGKQRWETNDGWQETDISFGINADDELRSSDMGVNFIAGFEFNSGVLFKYQLNVGLSDNANGLWYSSRNNYMVIMIGYMFRKRK